MKRLKDAKLCDGWKAYGLSCIMKKNLNVPDGVIINQNDIKKILAGNIEELETYLADLRLYNDLAVRVSIGNTVNTNISYKGIFKSVFGIPFDIEKLKDAINIVSESAKEKIREYNINDSFNIIIQKMIYNTGLSGFAFSDAVDKNGEKVIRIEINEEQNKKAVPGRKNSSVVTVKISELFTEDPKIKIYGKPHNYSKMLKLARIIYRLEKYFNKPVFAEWCITNNNNILFYYAEPMADLTSITSGFKQPCVSIPYTVNPYLQLTAKIEEHEKEIKRLKEEELEFQNRVSQIRNKVAALKTDDIFEFGNYNGKKLKWKVLDIKSDRMYVFCQDLICEKPFDESENRTNIWEQCTLRKWLNDQFYRLTFDNAEKECIKEVNSDKITLLSKEEVETLLKTIDFFMACTKTPYIDKKENGKTKAVYFTGVCYPISYATAKIDLDFEIFPALYLKL